MPDIRPRLILLGGLMFLSIAAVGADCCNQAHPPQGPGIDYSNIQFLAPQGVVYLPFLQYRYGMQNNGQAYGLLQAPMVPVVSHAYSLPNINYAQLYQDLSLFCASTRSGNYLVIGFGQENDIGFTYTAGRCQGTSLYDRARAGLRRK